MSLTVAGGSSQPALVTPAQILARLLLADGAGSGLDADLLRGLGPDGTVLPGSIGGLPGFNSIPPRPPRNSYPSSLFRS